MKRGKCYVQNVEDISLEGRDGEEWWNRQRNRIENGLWKLKEESVL